MRKFSFVQSHIFETEVLENVCKDFVWELRIPRSILVHDLRGIVSFRNRILISKAS